LKLSSFYNRSKMCKLYTDNGHEPMDILCSPVRCSCCGRLMYPDTYDIIMDAPYNSRDIYFEAILDEARSSNIFLEIALCHSCTYEQVKSFVIASINRNKIVTMPTLNGIKTILRRYYLFNTYVIDMERHRQENLSEMRRPILMFSAEQGPQHEPRGLIRSITGTLGRRT